MNDYESRYEALCDEICASLEKHVFSLPDSLDRFKMGMDCGIDVLCTMILSQTVEENNESIDISVEAIGAKFRKRIKEMREDLKQDKGDE